MARRSGQSDDRTGEEGRAAADLSGRSASDATEVAEPAAVDARRGISGTEATVTAQPDVVDAGRGVSGTDATQVAEPEAAVSGTEPTLADDTTAEVAQKVDASRRERGDESARRGRDPVSGDRADASSDRPADALLTIEPSLYERGDEIARGGMGRVVAARDERLGRPVALKELLHRDVGRELRFLREVRITARLQHPAIITIHEAGRWPNGRPFYAMKRVEGRPFDTVIAEKRNLGERLALLPNVIAVADALAYAHAQGVIHRDLKPANVLIGAFGETVVIDWGLAKDLRASEQQSSSSLASVDSVDPASAQTQVGSVLGTPAFMSPEQARGETVDERADVYAIGAILYNLLAGRPPHSGRNAGEVMGRMQRSSPKPIRQREPEVPRDLAAIVDKALARSPNDRYPTAAELAEDLRRFETGQLVSVREYSAAALLRRWAARHRTALAVAGVAALLMAVLGTVAIKRIIDKERVARAQRARAEVLAVRADEQRSIAVANSEVAEQRANEITMLQARSALDRDPTEAIAWLEQVGLGPERMARARAIAQQALSRGVATDVLQASDPVWSVAFSPDGARLAATWGHGRALVRELASGTSRFLEGLPAPITSLAFAPDGRSLAAVSEDGGVAAWELASGDRRIRGQLGGHGVRVAYSPNGAWLAAVGSVPQALVWSTASGQVRAFDADPVALEWFAFSPDSHFLATAGASGQVQLVDLVSGTMRVVARRPGSRVASVAFSPDGARLAILSARDGLSILTMASGRTTTFGSAGQEAHTAIFTPDGREIATAEMAGTVRLWDVATGRSRVFSGHKDAPSWIRFHEPTGRMITASLDGTLRVWDLATGEAQIIRGHAAEVMSLAVAPSGVMASGDLAGVLRVWPPPVQDSRVLGAYGSPMCGLAVAPDGREVAFAGERGLINLRDLGSDRARVLTGHADLVWELGFSSDGRWLVSASQDRTARLWDLEAGTSKVIVRLSSPVTKARFSAGGGHIALRGGENRVILWSMREQRAHVLGGDSQPLPVEYLDAGPRGEVFAAACSSGEVRVFDLSAGSERVLSGHAAPAVGVRFSPAGNALCSCDTSGVALLWDLDTGEHHQVSSACAPWVPPTFSADGALLAVIQPNHVVVVRDLRAGTQRELEGHQARIVGLSFAKGGRYLISSSEDSSVRVWDLETGSSRVLSGHRDLVACALPALHDSVLVTASGDHTVRLWADPFSDRTPTEPAALAEWLVHLTSATIEPGGGLQSPAPTESAATDERSDSSRK